MKKIMVFGSCFSRNMFNSSEYFNPGYKNQLNCEKTYFHSSIVSVVTPALKYSLDSYTDILPEFKQFTQLDFSKSFFDDVETDQPDYILIDLYSDAIKDILYINQETAITISPIIEHSEIMNDLPKHKLLTHNDNDVYFLVFEIALQQFKNRLLNIFPENRIILNSANFTKFYRHENVTVPYKTPDVIDAHNLFWDKINELFINLFPSARNLDMRNTIYIGDSNYPFGHSVSHYESGYYKEQFEKLLEIIN